MSIKPKFQHDCADCQFVGRWKGADCYIHRRPDSEHTFTRRYSSDPAEYVSAPRSVAIRSSEYQAIMCMADDWDVLLKRA